MIEKFLLLPGFLLFILLGCYDTNTSENNTDDPGKVGIEVSEELETIAEELETGSENVTVTTLIATIDNISGFEDSLSLTFKDETGKEIVFTNFDTDISEYYTIDSTNNQSPELSVNETIKYKKYKLTYTIEKPKGESPGKKQEIPVLKTIEILE